MPEVQTEANFSYSYLYEQTGESDLKYVVLGFESQVESEFELEYAAATKAATYDKEAFWTAGKTYADSTRVQENTTVITNGNLTLSTTSRFWVSYPIDLTLFTIQSLESLVTRAYVPGNSSLKLYLAYGNSQAGAESAPLIYVADSNAVRALNISGNKWFILAIELVGGP